ncbi:MAG: GNAT family N-acetyltransferase [Clostridia bacterium]|nr:GNAT family N-acetyltransferase [Clostridia bacterium]
MVEFLTSFDLKFNAFADYTAYIEQDDKIVATISLAKNVICDLAVSAAFQGENLATALIMHAIEKLRAEKVYAYKVFTKPLYLDRFLDLGFRVLVQGKSFVALEGGESNIKTVLKSLKTKITMDLDGFEDNYGAVVINANPFTTGHLSLIEHALSKHKKVLIFVLEEDVSEFSFKERISLAFLATRQYRDRVCVLPSSEYMVSKATFPDYFMRSEQDVSKAHAEYDALLFEQYFMKELNISKRYLGSEEKEYMTVYNTALSEILGAKLEIVERFKQGGETVSAGTVRELLKAGDEEKAIGFIPKPCQEVFKMIIGGKQWS